VELDELDPDVPPGWNDETPVLTLDPGSPVFEPLLTGAAPPSRQRLLLPWWPLVGLVGPGHPDTAMRPWLRAGFRRCLRLGALGSGVAPSSLPARRAVVESVSPVMARTLAG